MRLWDRDAKSAGMCFRTQSFEASRRTSRGDSVQGGPGQSVQGDADLNFPHGRDAKVLVLLGRYPGSSEGIC